jgi:hypothetical protein
VIGFFVLRLCRKLAFVNRRGAKKPNEHVVFVWKALGKVPFWEDVLNEVKNGSPVTQAYFYVFAEDHLSPSLIKLHFTFIILTFNVSIVKR